MADCQRRKGTKSINSYILSHNRDFRKRSANHLSVVRDNRRWNSNLTGTSNGKFRTITVLW